MQSIQVHLSGAARSWIKKLPLGSIDSWETFEDMFVKNFLSTCKKPASIKQLRACRQKYDESMRTYIQRWNIIKNSAQNISDERAIDVFVVGIRRKDLVEDLGRTNPKTIAALMKIANRWADGEDVVHNKRHRSPEDDRNRNIKIDDDSLASSQIMKPPAKYRLVSEELAEVIVGMTIKRVVNSAMTTGTVPVPIGKMMDQGSRGRMCHPKFS
jgi:hypothetical protein